MRSCSSGRGAGRAAELAQVSRRDIALAQIWQNPEMYRGVPIHLLGTAQRVLRYPSKLSKTGWIHEASIITPDAPATRMSAYLKRRPTGFPIGTNVSERRGIQRLLLQDLEVRGG